MEVAPRVDASPQKTRRFWPPGPWLSLGCVAVGLLLAIGAQLTLSELVADRARIDAARQSLEAMPREHKYASFRNEEGAIAIESTGETRRSLSQLKGEVALIGKEMHHTTMRETADLVRNLGVLLCFFGVAGFASRFITRRVNSPDP